MTKQLVSYTGSIFTCERCDRDWKERPDEVRDRSGLKIVEVLHVTPKFCPACKSPSWNIPRNA
jgi:hypothetical protein